jgi:2-dehydropantoate 2-reductase
MPEPASAPQANAAPYKRVAVMGTGAVGGYFGGMLARAGTTVTFIARPATAEAISRRGLFIDSVHFQETIRAEASSDPAAVANAELILFCVKTTDTAAVAKSILPHLAPTAVVLSLQNGVDNAEQIEAAGIHAIPAVVYVAASVPEPGRIKHAERGDLAIGGPANRRAEIERIAATFAKAGVACKVSDNIQVDLWNKFVFNCALNAPSAIAQVGYGPVAQNDWSREMTLAAARETIAVARAQGIELPEKDILERLVQFALKMGPVTSSTAQDIARGKRTEIDSLNGYVVLRGAALGVPTPVNHTLTALLKLIEAKF